MNNLSDLEFSNLAKKLFDLTGIFLGEEKKVLMASRLARRVTQLGFGNFKQYANEIEHNPTEATQFINLLTTNKTDWFREASHFDALKHWLQSGGSTRKKTEPLLTWSAACSSGEEVYTLVMVLRSVLGPGQYRILGTDIDTEVLAKAERAEFSKEQVFSQVPGNLLQKYFENVSGSEKPLVQFSRDARSGVKFRQFNLIQSELGSNIAFDVIFLRNVLIYFKRETIELILTRLLRHLKPGGLLFIGHSESLNGYSLPLKQAGESVYSRVG